MKRQRLHLHCRALAGILAPLLTLGFASGAFLTADFPEEDQAAKPEPPRVRPIPPPEPRPPIIRPPRPIPHHDANAATRLIRQVSVGTPYRYQHHTIYPINLAHGQAHSGLRTLDEALRNGWIDIEERDRATVSKITIRNRSGHSIFLMAGEIIGGGKQNRVVQHDLILPPRSGVVTMPVYCIEQNRWGRSAGAFESKRNLAHPGLRKSAVASESQDSIWREVEERSRAAGVSARTKNYEALYADRAVQSKLDGCLPHFHRFVGSRTVGAIAVVGYRIVGADLFSDPRVFNRLWHKILRSYALDYFSYPYPLASPHESHRRFKLVSPDVRGFLNNALAANYSRQHTPGSGTLYRISGRSDGETIIWGGNAVHVGLFGNAPAVRPHIHRR